MAAISGTAAEQVPTTLSQTMHLLNGSRKPTAPTNRQLIVFIDNSAQQVDDVIWELTF